VVYASGSPDASPVPEAPDREGAPEASGRNGGSTIRDPASAAWGAMPCQGWQDSFLDPAALRAVCDMRTNPDAGMPLVVAGPEGLKVSVKRSWKVLENTVDVSFFSFCRSRVCLGPAAVPVPCWQACGGLSP
jgi:hypothetical protein